MQTTSKNTSLVNFCEQYSPDYQMQICDNPDKCYFGEYPTLSQLKGDYGKNAAIAWVIPQLTDVVAYCGCRDKLDKMQYKECAFVIATEYHWLKVSELMLFFHRFKAGHYGRFYGAVDPLVITTALRDFCKERAEAYVRHEQQQREEADREKAGKAVSWEEHCMNVYGEVRPHPLSRLNLSTENQKQ